MKMSLRASKPTAPASPVRVVTGVGSFGRTFSSLRNYNYRLYWLGQLLSVIGTWIQRIAQAWLVLQLTNSSFSLGLVTALQSLPITFFALFGGVLADRFPKRPVIVTTQAIMAGQALVLALLITTHQIQVWHIYVLAMVLGLATSIDNPTRQAFVSELVGPDESAKRSRAQFKPLQYRAYSRPGDRWRIDRRLYHRGPLLRQRRQFSGRDRRTALDAAGRVS